jgi:hypothetical protein
MCIKCHEINDSIARYRRLRGQFNDQQIQEAADRLVVALETKKLALHPDEKK